MIETIYVVFASLFQVAATVCKPSQVLDIESGICSDVCSHGKFIFDQRCVESCPLNTIKLETGIASFCYFENDLSCDTLLCSSEFPFCHKMNCLKSCPEFTVEYKKKCLMQCPVSAQFLTAFSCNGTCTSGRKSCSDVCPRTHPYVFTSKYITQCLSICPSFTEISENKTKCNLKCPAAKSFLYKSTCFSKCPEIAPFISKKKTDYSEIYNCVEKCPGDTVIDGSRCVESCPTSKFLHNNSCVKECPPTNKNAYAKDLRKRSDVFNFGHADFMCVAKCNSNETLGYNGDPLYVNYRNVCVTRCPSEAKYELDRYCLKQCPDDFPFHETGHKSIKCLNECKNLILNQTCVQYCPSNVMYVNNQSCTNACPSNKPFAKRTNIGLLCVEKCPQFYNHKNNHCSSSCESPYVIFNNSCIEVCPPDNPYTEKVSSGHSCVNNCQGYRHGMSCVSSCPSEAQYSFNMTCTNECGAELPYKYHKVKRIRKGWQYETIHEYICVESCPNSHPYMKANSCVTTCPLDQNMVLNNTCHKSCPRSHMYMIKDQIRGIIQCSNKCPVLTTIDYECVNRCPADARYNYTGKCVDECKADIPYKLMIFPEHCVVSCPSNTFLLDINKTCVLECPNDHFSFNKKCLSSCPDSHPFNYTRNILPNVNYTCVARCSPESFELNGTCYDKCPDNTSGHVEKCIHKCPIKKPYRNSMTGTCVDRCSGDLNLYRNSSCQRKCKEDAPFIETNQCVEKCSDEYRFFVPTEQGSKCFNKCPNSYLEVDGSNHCTDKCPDNRLIVNNICTNSTTCPTNMYIIDTRSGRECTGLCPPNYYILGKKCSLTCPELKAGNICTTKCPPSYPFKLKNTCYRYCPDTKVGYKSDCIYSYECRDMNYFINDKVCSKECPSTTIKNSEGNSCRDKSIFITLTLVGSIITTFSMASFCCMLFFHGYEDYSRNKKTSFDNIAFSCQELQEKEGRIGNSSVSCV